MTPAIITSLPKPLLSHVVSIIGSIRLVVLMAEYFNPFWYNISKNSDPSDFDTFVTLILQAWKSSFRWSTNALYYFLVFSVQKSIIINNKINNSFSTSFANTSLLHLPSMPVMIAFCCVADTLTIGLVGVSIFNYE